MVPGCWQVAVPELLARCQAGRRWRAGRNWRLLVALLALGGVLLLADAAPPSPKEGRAVGKVSSGVTGHLLPYAGVVTSDGGPQLV